MSIRWSWILSSLLALACASLAQPKLDALDCLAREDCIVVKVDNTGQYNVDFRINGRKYGDVNGYGVGTYSLYTNHLIHGNCAYVTALLTMSINRTVLHSPEVCIQSGQYYQVDITNNQSVIWLTPYKVGEYVARE